LLETIKPQYIILKPTLHGGIIGATEWIELARSMDIGWWITSALESNIGLNAIAQWCSTYNNPLPHWIVIDMQWPRKVSQVVTWRRPGSYAGTKTLQYYMGDNGNPDANTWVKLVEGAFPVGHPSTAGPDVITLIAEKPLTGRYLKLVMPDTFRPDAPYTQIVEIDVYEIDD
jgi:hypothetical protein